MAATLMFLVMSTCFTIDKDFIEFIQLKSGQMMICIHPYHGYQGSLLRATILLILDGFQILKLIK